MRVKTVRYGFYKLAPGLRVVQDETFNKRSIPSSLSFVDSSRESSIHLYACMRTAGPRYLSAFHQYEGQEVEQHAHKMHWRFTKSMVSVSECLR